MITDKKKRKRFQLNPINQRRWRGFKAHRRGFWSLWIFLALFFISLFAEFIANDRPLLVYYNSNLYFPIFKDYPETTTAESLRPRRIPRPLCTELIDEKDLPFGP